MRPGVFVGLLGLACNAVDPPTKADSPPPVDPGVPTDSTTPADDDAGCAVQALFVTRCTVCHQPLNLQGGLDLQSDPHGALVGVTSDAFGVVLVTPGDPAGSLLYRKITGTQTATEGASMPLGGALAYEDTALVERWITDGANVCGEPPTEPPDGAEPYHPPGWEDPLQHGLATNLQTETDCRTCHGPDLAGGVSGVACTSCHGAGWETTCTFCHGGVETPNGAPPEDIDNETDPTAISFPPHSEHVAGTRHLTYDCVQCHDKPTDALSSGHLFEDSTPGAAEIRFDGGIAVGGTKDAQTCTVYCHGNGRGDPGAIEIGATGLGCEDCHAFGGLGGRHEKHLDEGLDCEECHPDVTGLQITDPGLHVDGTVQIELPPSMNYTSTCNGSCHGEDHDDRTW